MPKPALAQGPASLAIPLPRSVPPPARIITQIVGFTGPRQGMTPPQITALRQQLHLLGTTHLHHGDCVGADAQAHTVGRELGLWIVGHPPLAQGLRAHCVFDEEREPKEFLSRNRAILLESQILVAAPIGPERLRSGTWSTIRLAKHLHLPRLVIDQHGVVHSYD